MKTQLVIMEAGMGSRFKEGIKQLTKLGPNGELIIDYSIYYAKKAGFDEVIFVIRKNIEDDFKTTIGNRIEKYISCKYVYQELDIIPNGFMPMQNRIKPYRTGDCILCAKQYIDSPFLIINADDYYGEEAFFKIHDYLINMDTSSKKYDICMAGFSIENTLSDNETVTRGLCKVDDNDYLISCNETYNIYKNDDDIIIGFDENKNEIFIKKTDIVSMNMWGFPINFIDCVENKFIKFLEDNDDINEEFLLPSIVNELLIENKATVKVLNVKDKWYGITYKEDKERVSKFLNSITVIHDVIRTTTLSVN